MQATSGLQPRADTFNVRFKTSLLTQCQSQVLDSKYDNLPGVEYEVFGDNKFAQNVPSLLPAILDELKLFRKQAKKDMAIAKASKDKTMEKIYDGKQLAYKVSMNSVYGCDAW